MYYIEVELRNMNEMTHMKDTEIKVRISQTLKERAFKLAARQGIKLSELVRKLIEREVSK